MPASRAVMARTGKTALTRCPASARLRKRGPSSARTRPASNPCFDSLGREGIRATTGSVFRRPRRCGRFGFPVWRPTRKGRPLARSSQGPGTQIEFRCRPRRRPPVQTRTERTARAPHRRLAATHALRRAKQSSRDRSRGTRSSEGRVARTTTLLAPTVCVDGVTAPITGRPRPIEAIRARGATRPR
jgi:hypothetical protein